MIGLLSICLMGYALQDTPDTVRSLPYYIEAAQEHSPLIHDLGRQAELQQDELQRLRAAYTRSKVELNGDFLFVPILSRDNGHTSFQWNAQDATDYYGYDLGVSSGHLHAGVTWTQPLLGKLTYRSAKEQAQISTAIADNRIGMERHQMERSVTEQ
ncbi:MAG: hypothetical protein LUC45_00535 [Paraprevotella sp.]|nr:hypothetical protein [Paraprevotella sp.]